LPLSDWKTKYVTTALLLLGGVIIVYLCFRIFQPFLAPVVWATVLAVLIHPLQAPGARLFRSSSVAAVVNCLVGFLMVGVPFFYLVSSLPSELKEAYSGAEAVLNADPAGTADPRLARAWQRLAETAAKTGYALPMALPDLLRRNASRLISLAPRLIGEAVEYLFDAVLTFLTLFFFLRDGDRLLHWLRDLVPLGSEQTDEFFGKIRDVVRATVLGNLSVALAQGVIGGLLLWLLGVPTPMLWGVLMGTLSLVPPLGAWLVWVPAGAILIWQGYLARGVILLAGGFFLISVVDNVLRPLIIGQRTQLPTLMIFFSLLGGLQFFGAAGLIVGPVMVALLIGVLEFLRGRLQGMAKPPPAESLVLQSSGSDR